MTTSVPTTPGPRRIPSLDGLRAISIVLVMVSHLIGTDHFPVRDGGALAPFGDLGYLGVRIFFVISGFLITTLLVREHEKTGTISLREFYVRRAFRIFPAAYVFVGVMLLLGALGVFQFRDRDALHALTYTMNYHYLRSWELGHLWSLSVEEQYYLLWPALVLLVGPPRVAKLALAMIVLAPVMRVLAWFLMPYRDDVMAEAYPCVMDAIAAGSLLAVLQPRLAGLRAYDRFVRSRAFWLVPVVMLAMNRQLRVSFDVTLGIPLQIAAIAVIVDRVVRVDRGHVFRLLNWAPMVWLGTLSYSLYLWQEPFLNHKAHALVNVFPLNVALALACAVASHYLVERPFFRFRDAWASRRARLAPAPAAAVVPGPRG